MQLRNDVLNIFMLIALLMLASVCRILDLNCFAARSSLRGQLVRYFYSKCNIHQFYDAYSRLARILGSSCWSRVFLALCFACDWPCMHVSVTQDVAICYFNVWLSKYVAFAHKQRCSARWTLFALFDPAATTWHGGAHTGADQGLICRIVTMQCASVLCVRLCALRAFAFGVVMMIF